MRMNHSNSSTGNIAHDSASAPKGNDGVDTESYTDISNEEYIHASSSQAIIFPEPILDCLFTSLDYTCS